MSVLEGSGSGVHDEFDQMIASFSACTDAEELEQIRLGIWERFGTVGATFISDMANFSSTSREYGVCHFLKMIHRTRRTVAPIIADNGGQLLKCDADNCYAFFEKPGRALQASLDINAELFRMNRSNDLAEHIYLSVGIDFGRLLLVGSQDFYGDPVNTASKLGEDLAGRSETLVTDRALAETDYVAPENAEHMVARISDIEISYIKLSMTEASDK
jgi:class 3 adenylate cyclase